MAQEDTQPTSEIRHQHAGTLQLDRTAVLDGLFRSESEIRRISSEALGLLGGGRAVLLQLAHPLIAAGVAEHSTFESDPLARLMGTLELMHALVFGNRRQVQRALQRFNAMHARIGGHLAQAAGRFPAGTPYTANDPALKLWVHATLVDTSLITYERFVAPLSSDERRRYYDDTRRLARLLGIPDSILPPTLDAFQDYIAAMLVGDSLMVTDTARYLAWSVLNPDVGTVQYATARMLCFVTAGLLPEQFRTAYGLIWGQRHQRLLDSFSVTTRLLRPVAPAWLWRSPQLEGANLLRLLLWSEKRNG